MCRTAKVIVAFSAALWVCVFLPAQMSDGQTTVPSGISGGHIVSQVAPKYPSEAQAAHVSGAVVLRALISKTGAVTQPIVISGPPQLQQAAMDAVKQWKHKPYLNGNATEVQTVVTVNFAPACVQAPALAAGSVISQDRNPTPSIGPVPETSLLQNKMSSAKNLKLPTRDADETNCKKPRSSYQKVSCVSLAQRLGREPGSDSTLVEKAWLKACGAQPHQDALSLPPQTCSHSGAYYLQSAQYGLALAAENFSQCFNSRYEAVACVMITADVYKQNKMFEEKKRL